MLPLPWAEHIKDQSSCEYQVVKMSHWKVERVGGGWKSLNNVKREDEGVSLERDTDRKRHTVGRRLADVEEGDCWYCNASWWWICTHSSQLVMGACELLEHDSVLKGQTEATHEYGTWSQRTTPLRLIFITTPILYFNWSHISSPPLYMIDMIHFHLNAVGCFQLPNCVDVNYKCLFFRQPRKRNIRR